MPSSALSLTLESETASSQPHGLGGCGDVYLRRGWLTSVLRITE